MKIVLETPSLTATADGAVAEVVLTRPDVLNCFDNQLHADFLTMLATVPADPAVRCILLSSTGRAFSAGGDVHWMQEINTDRARAREVVRTGYRVMTDLLDLRVPLVTAVQGAAMGLGANIALASDLVVATSAARFADSHVLMGLVAGDGGAVVWPQAGGINRAKRHLLTGDPLKAADAFAAGMVTDLVDNPSDLLPTARALAQRIAALPPLAVQGTKRALNQILRQRAGEVFELSLALELDTITSEDLREATDAFLQKRTGEYKGR
jgi:enoyl-CoA hydratase